MTPDGARAPADAFENLSPREFQVFSLMVEGVRAKEIAARLKVGIVYKIGVASANS